MTPLASRCFVGFFESNALAFAIDATSSLEKATNGCLPFSDMESTDAYYERKAREAALINDRLAEPLELDVTRTAAAAIDRKFRLAAALRAERSLESWAITETARPEVQRWNCGAYRFSFGYQRADLKVRGPAIYPALERLDPRVPQDVVYTSSGMSAIAAVVTAAIRLRGNLEVIAPRGCYSETRELLQSFGEGVSIVPASPAMGERRGDAMRVLLVDSCVSDGFDEYRQRPVHGVDVVVFDTTCFWKGSARVRIAIDWAMRANLPLILVRSHAKLDSLGIEYGRLGSIVFAGHASTAHPWMSELRRQTETSVRLYGVAPIPAHFPPFTGTDEYRRCSRMRTASIIRSTRRIARQLSRRLPRRENVREFQHGVYLALVPGADLRMKDVKSAAATLAAALGKQGLPVKHAGSFGFDFVAVEWFFDAILRRNVIRLAGADLPVEAVDAIVEAIATWWSQQRMSSRHPSTDRLAASSAAL